MNQITGIIFGIRQFSRVKVTEYRNQFLHCQESVKYVMESSKWENNPHMGLFLLIHILLGLIRYVYTICGKKKSCVSICLEGFHEFEPKKQSISVFSFTFHFVKTHSFNNVANVSSNFIFYLDLTTTNANSNHKKITYKFKFTQFEPTK